MSGMPSACGSTRNRVHAGADSPLEHRGGPGLRPHLARLPLPLLPRHRRAVQLLQRQPIGLLAPNVASTRSGASSVSRRIRARYELSAPRARAGCLGTPVPKPAAAAHEAAPPPHLSRCYHVVTAKE
jgi:hypothetical protein